MHVHDQRMLGIRRHAQRLHQKCFDLKFIVVADEGKRFDLRDLLPAEHLRVQIRDLLRAAPAALNVANIKLAQVPRARECVGNRARFRDRECANTSQAIHHHFRRWTARRMHDAPFAFWHSRHVGVDGLSIQMHAPAFLHGEIDRLAIRRPYRRALSIVDRREFMPIRAVRIHHPDVSILHGRLAIGQPALGRAKSDHLPVGRKFRVVLGVFRGR